MVTMRLIKQFDLNYLGTLDAPLYKLMDKIKVTISSKMMKTMAAGWTFVIGGTSTIAEPNASMKTSSRSEIEALIWPSLLFTNLEKFMHSNWNFCLTICSIATTFVQFSSEPQQHGGHPIFILNLFSKVVPSGHFETRKPCDCSEFTTTYVISKNHCSFSERLVLNSLRFRDYANFARRSLIIRSSIFSVYSMKRISKWIIYEFTAKYLILKYKCKRSSERAEKSQRLS